MDQFSGQGQQDGSFLVQKNDAEWPVFRSPTTSDPQSDSFAWGDNTSATQLTAFALLWDVAGLQIARQFYLRFAGQVMAMQPVRPGWCWTLTGADIVEWLLRTATAPAPPPA